MTPVGGLATFSGLAEDTAASGYTIVATSPGLATIISHDLDVLPATPTQLAIKVPAPDSMPAGSKFGLAVAAEDQYGNIVTDYPGSVTIALANNPGQATLLGGPFAMNATGGVANFSPNLILDRAASGYTFLATSSGLTSVTSGSVTVTPGAATQLVVETQPPASLASPTSTFGFVVAAEDQYGNVATSFGGPVRASAAGGSGATLGGNTVVTASSGVASFTGLTLTGANSPIPIQVTGPGLTPATTSPVSSGTPAVLQFATGSASVDEDAGTATFQIVRSGATGSAVSVNVATSGGNAAPGVNYSAINQTISFAAGQTTQTVTIPIINAGSLAQTMTVNVVLSSPAGDAVLASPSSATLSILNVGASTTGSGPLVTLESIQVIKNKKHKVGEVLMTFSGGLNATEAASLSEYTLIQAGKRGSFTAKNAKSIKLLSAVYNSTNHTVAITPKKPFALTKAIELVVNGSAPGLEDSNGRLIDGNHDGQAGGNATAVLKGKATTITSAVVDLLLQHDDVASLTKARKS